MKYNKTTGIEGAEMCKKTNKKIQSITSALVMLMLVGIAVGYSYTDTGFRASWFATDDGSFNTSTGTVNVSNASGTLPRARHDSYTMFNNSDNNMNGKNITNGTNYSAKIVGGVIYADQYTTPQLALATGSDIYFPDGVYSTSNSLSLVSNQRITCSPNAHIIMSGSAEMGGSDLTNITISGCDIRGSGQNALSFTNGSDIIIEKNHIHNAGLKGINVGGNAWNFRVVLNNISYNGQEGIVFASDIAKNTSPHDNYVEDNIFFANGVYGGVGTINQPVPYPIKRIHIEKNIVEGNFVSENGFMLNGCTDCYVIDNVILNVTKHGIDGGIIGGYSQQYINDTIFSNNIVDTVGNNYNGINIQLGFNNTVMYNKIKNRTGSGVDIRVNSNIVGSGNSTVYGNRINSLDLPGSVFVGATQNWGISPYNFGKASAPPSAFGAGDTYFDTDLGEWCTSTAAGTTNYLNQTRAITCS